jgi:hypothetical protein
MKRRDSSQRAGFREQDLLREQVSKDISDMDCRSENH